MCLQLTMTRRLGELKMTSKIRAKGWTENPKPDSGKGTSLREREGANTVIYDCFPMYKLPACGQMLFEDILRQKLHHDHHINGQL